MDLSEVVFQEMTRETLARNEKLGWYVPGTDYNEPNKVGAEIALIHSEVSEILEAFRDNGLNRNTTPAGKPDDVGSECADVLIRLLDFCGRRGIDLAKEYRRKSDYNETRPFRHGRKQL